MPSSGILLLHCAVQDFDKQALSCYNLLPLQHVLRRKYSPSRPVPSLGMFLLLFGFQDIDKPVPSYNKFLLSQHFPRHRFSSV